MSDDNKPHQRIPMPAWAVLRLGTQTHPASPTTYLLGGGERDQYAFQIPCLDHPTCWTKKGRRVVISEPYGLTFDGIREMVAFAEAHGLEFSIDCRFASYYPGHCEAVIWTKKGAPLA